MFSVEYQSKPQKNQKLIFLYMKELTTNLLCYKQPPPVSVVVVGATCNLLPGYPPTCADATIMLLQVITLR